MEASINGGDSRRAVAKRYGLSPASLQRHMANCYRKREGLDSKEPPPPPAPMPAEEDGIPLDAYSRLQALATMAEGILDRAKGANKDFLQLQAINETRRTIESMIKGFEAQKRIEALYQPQERFSGTQVYEYLKERHPEVLAGLLEHLKEARQG